MNAFLQYGLFYMVALLLILSFRKSPSASGEKLGRDTSRELKGLAILMVLFGHMTLVHGWIGIPATPVLGAPAVEIFLFLSSFGLVSSYHKKGLKGFIPRRLLAVLIPLWIVNLVKIVYYAVFHVPPKSILLSFILVDIGSTDPSMWYIQYILLCYLIFFLVFCIRKLSLKWKAILVFLIFASAAIVNGFVFYQGLTPDSPFMECYSHHLSFGLGVIFYLFYQRYQRLSGKGFSVLCALAFIFTQLNAYGFVRYETYYLLNFSYLVFCVSLFGLLSARGLHSKLLAKLGDRAYYIYLNEYVLMLAVRSLVDIPDGYKALLVLVLSVALSSPTKLVGDWIVQKVSSLIKT